MPANKNKLLRMTVIVEMLRKNEYPNYNRFIDEMKRRDAGGVYELSAKTFGRDITDLRTEFGAPIEYEPSYRGYYLSDREWCNEKLMVEPFEMKSAVLGQKFAESLMPEPLRSDINKAVCSLLARNSSGFSEQAELNMMQIINPVQLPLSAEIFRIVFRAWEKRQKLQLTYSSAKGLQSDKVFEPHILAWQSGIWYLKGLLLGTPKFSYKTPYKTILAVHRISHAEMISSSFEGDQKILATVKAGKLFEFPRLPEVRLRFQPEVALQVRERFSCPPGCLQEETDGALLVVLKDFTEYEAIDVVLWAHGEVKVLEPESLRQKILHLAETMQRNQE